MHEGAVLTIIELKSQVGSFGNNQYDIALDRLRLEGDMNAVCLATTNRHEDNPVTYPNPTMTFGHFARSLRLRLEEVADASEPNLRS